MRLSGNKKGLEASNNQKSQMSITHSNKLALKKMSIMLILEKIFWEHEERTSILFL